MIIGSLRIGPNLESENWRDVPPGARSIPESADFRFYHLFRSGETQLLRPSDVPKLFSSSGFQRSGLIRVSRFFGDQ
jgi:hypothetical protein